MKIPINFLFVDLIMSVAKGEIIDIDVEIGNKISIECPYTDGYVDFRKEIFQKNSKTSKQKTIFMRTANSDGSNQKDMLLDKSNRWKSLNNDSSSNRIRLEMKESLLKDKGIYSCIDAKRTETQFNITLYANPSTTVDFQEILSVTQGDNVRIGECIAANSFPESQIHWKDQNGKVYPGVLTVENSLEKFTSKNSLDITVDAQQSIFECVVKHRGTVVEGDHYGRFSQSLDILTKPSKVKIQLAKSSLNVGDELKVMCQSKSNPDPMFRWNISHPNNTKVDKTHWTFEGNMAMTRSLKSTDSGLWIKCIAYNNVGSSEDTTMLEISESTSMFAFTGNILSVVGLVSFGIFVIIIAFVVFRCAKQRKTAVYKTGNVRDKVGEV